ncbi:MAG: hypothetical protein NC543_09810 [bacterium]|nr:hypothetical protein [bacterium]MCM1376165.1 hypothetical protein [Muribaculum sp.]
MGRNRRRKKKDNLEKNENKCVSVEQLTDIYAEAYYRALKRIELERNVLQERREPREKKPWYLRVLIWLNIIFFPFKLNKNIQFQKRLYDGLLIVVISTILEGVGGVLWICGAYSFAKGCLGLLDVENICDLIVTIIVSIFFIIIGSFFFLAGKTFGEETESNRVYAYSASVLALVSCILSLIALLKG